MSAGVFHRTPKFVDKANFEYFHRRWAAIDRMWPHCLDLDNYEVIRSLRESARDELRAEMRAAHSVGPADHMIPV